jgi:hypothetical protein
LDRQFPHKEKSKGLKGGHTNETILENHLALYFYGNGYWNVLYKN